MARRQSTSAAQLSFAWGGARTGAGRPARGPIAAERHAPRPALEPRFPVHVTARVDRAIKVLGRRDAYAILRRAVKLSLARTDFRIVRLAITDATHIELLVEADNKLALARGMQGFQVSAARAVNRAARRRGTVFPDRYRMTILRSQAAARAVISAPMRVSTAEKIEAPATAETAILLACCGRWSSPIAAQSAVRSLARGPASRPRH